MSWKENARKAASKEALKQVKDGFVIGLGSGATMELFINELAHKIRFEKLNILAVPSSTQVELKAAALGIKLTSLNEHPELDLAIDGADQVEKKTLNLIKGGGAALTREKIIDSTAKKLIIIVDEEKLCRKLTHPVPLEVIPFGVKAIMKKIEKVGGRPILREGLRKVGPVITDNGNFIVDVDFGELNSPEEVNFKLKMVPGVIETGLFLKMVNEVYAGEKSGNVRILTKT
ncbi:ribose-5-phosphate isomerase RpiA [Candidatus Bathyarchaeota archaeon]|nr:ribose-5-phosphate isomerase RpiA [Candidatus Bathyarchaeota archaeon]